MTLIYVTWGFVIIIPCRPFYKSGTRSVEDVGIGLKWVIHQKPEYIGESGESSGTVEQGV